MAVEIPITFIGLDGLPTTDRVSGSPCIEVQFYTEHDIDTDGNITVTETWALLDTGADHFYVDVSLLKLHKAPTVRPILANGSATFVHVASIRLPTAKFIFTPQEVASRDLMAEGQPFRIILGRRFFEYAQLTFDIAKGHQPSLTFHGLGG